MTINQLKHYIEETRRMRDWALKDGNVERFEFLSEVIDRRSSELYKAELKEHIAAI